MHNIHEVGEGKGENARDSSGQLKISEMRNSALDTEVATRGSCSLRLMRI